MKRLIMIFIIFFIVLIIAICCFFMSMYNKTDISFAKTGETMFLLDDSDNQMQLSNQDLFSITEIFDNKKLYTDHPSCGFTEDVSIRLNDTEIFCIACDSCPVIFWENKNQYFRLSEEEYSELKCILFEYCFVFPCI